MSFISIVHPFSLLLLFEYLQKDREATTIVTGKVLEAFQAEYHSDIPLLKTSNPIINKALIEYKKEIKKVFHSKVSDFLVYEGDLKPISLIVTDKIFFLSLLDKKGRVTTRFLIAFEPQALKWGEELFMYYKERSKSVPSSLSTLWNLFLIYSQNLLSFYYPIFYCIFMKKSPQCICPFFQTENFSRN